MGYKNIKIVRNKRKTKNKQLLEEINRENKEIQKNRSKTEGTYAYIKSFKRITIRYDKKQ